MRRSLGAVLALAVAVPLAVSACTSRHQEVGHVRERRPSAQPPLLINLTPAQGRRGLPVTTEVGTSVDNGRIESVRVADPRGRRVAGQMREDGSSWVPAEPLDYARTYTATVTAAGRDGVERTRSTTFTTMARPSGARIGTGLYLFSGQTYGVALPIAVEFDTGIPERARAAVERRLFVSASPRQVGVWHWYGGRQVLYRTSTARPRYASATRSRCGSATVPSR